MPKRPRTIRQAEAARRLGIKPPSVVEALDRGDLDEYRDKVTGLRLVTLASLTRFQRTREEGGK